MSKESVSGRGKSKCKVPEVRNGLVKKANVAGTGEEAVDEAASCITPEPLLVSGSSVL